jgi:hypothetical protein
MAHADNSNHPAAVEHASRWATLVACRVVPAIVASIRSCTAGKTKIVGANVAFWPMVAPLPAVFDA